MRTSPVMWLAFAGCWTSSTQPREMTEPQPRTTTAPVTERRAILRIDEQPGGKKFQGVWLELDGGTMWVIDYRPRQPWRHFENREVLVTGGCYQPFGQAINATHFRVDRLRYAVPERGRQPYLEIGPEQILRGEFVDQTAPAGSKLAGSTSAMFRAEDGSAWGIVVDQRFAPGTRATVRGRVLVADLTYAARTGDSDLWVVDVMGADWVEDPRTRPTPITCPEP